MLAVDFSKSSNIGLLFKVVDKTTAWLIMKAQLTDYWTKLNQTRFVLRIDNPKLASRWKHHTQQRFNTEIGHYWLTRRLDYR